MAADEHLSGLQFSVTHPDELGTIHWARKDGDLVGHAMSISVPGEPVELAGIRVQDQHQGHGYGHQLLDHVIHHHEGSPITLTPSPYGNEPMSKDQLKTFYGGHGFRPMNNGGMIRRPRG